MEDRPFGMGRDAGPALTDPEIFDRMNENRPFRQFCAQSRLAVRAACLNRTAGALLNGVLAGPDAGEVRRRTPEDAGSDESWGFAMKQTQIKLSVKPLVLAAMFMGLGLVLPFLTGQVPQIGNMLLPMHLPVLLCGLICGWQYGGAVGFVLPLFRYALFGAPPMPAGIAMAFELAAYGAVVGFLYARSRWQCIVALYRCLIAALIAGRIVWAAARVFLAGLAQVPFSWQIFLSGAFLTAIPGVLLQLIVIPAIMVALNRTGLVPFRREAAGHSV